VLWFAVVLVGLGIDYYLLSYGAGWFLAALTLAGASVLVIAPKWL
jgi:hypothetical protein